MKSFAFYRSYIDCYRRRCCYYYGDCDYWKAFDYLNYYYKNYYYIGELRMREDESLTHRVHPVSFYWVDLECMFSLFRHYTKIKKKTC